MLTGTDTQRVKELLKEIWDEEHSGKGGFSIKLVRLNREMQEIYRKQEAKEPINELVDKAEAWRKAQGLSVKDFSILIDTDISTWYKVRAGQRQPTKYMKIMLSQLPPSQKPVETHQDEREPRHSIISVLTRKWYNFRCKYMW